MEIVLVTIKVQRILEELKNSLSEFYGNRLKGVYLFGSFATGKDEEGSDIDIAVILDNFISSEDEVDNVMGIIYEYSYKNGIVVSLVPIREIDWENRNTPLIMNIKKEGLLLQ